MLYVSIPYRHVINEDDRGRFELESTAFQSPIGT